MKVSKPRTPRVYLIAMDADTRQSRSTTVYHATPEQVIDLVTRTIAAQEQVEGGAGKHKTKRTADVRAA